MSVVTGTVEYKLGVAPLTGCEFSYSVNELNTVLHMFTAVRKTGGV